MTCFSPIKIPKNGYVDLLVTVPCGRCNGCRIQKSREWAIRCMHETKANGDNNSFITLTYNGDHLPKDASLNHEHFQKFIRSLRKRTGEKIRYYMCGEYGRATKDNGYIARPHFHSILFGYSFPDKTPHTVRRNNQVYRSKLLEQTWEKGFSEIGNVTFKSCAYVARYIMKKQKKTDDKYTIIDNETGEITGYRKPEYTHMSLKPGIGSDYWDKNKIDLYEYVMIEAPKKMEVPRYYKEKLKIEQPKLHEMLRDIRVKKAQQSPDNTNERLEVRNYIQGLKLQKLKREL